MVMIKLEQPIHQMPKLTKAGMVDYKEQLP
jgi:hypothetical protein